MEDAGTAAPLRRAAAAYREAYVAAHDAQQASGPEAQQRADALRAQLQQYSILSSDDAFRWASAALTRFCEPILQMFMWQVKRMTHSSGVVQAHLQQ